MLLPVDPSRFLAILFIEIVMIITAMGEAVL
jgi:hypothetical protein